MNDNNQQNITLDDRGKIYLFMGLIIATWSEIENYLFIIFASAVKAENIQALSESFHTVSNFRNKLEITNVAFESAFEKDDPKLLEQWKNLQENLSDCSEIRNKIAHFMVVSMNTPIKNELRLYTRLQPPFYNMNAARKDNARNKNITKYSYQDLEKIAGKFIKQKENISVFMSKLRGHLKMPPVYI